LSDDRCTSKYDRMLVIFVVISDFGVKMNSGNPGIVAVSLLQIWLVIT